jgi:hypothetical protein
MRQQQLSVCQNNLDLTGAAIATADRTPNRDFIDDQILVERENVPSISLPRQSTGICHFALGRLLEHYSSMAISHG